MSDVSSSLTRNQCWVNCFSNLNKWFSATHASVRLYDENSYIKLILVWYNFLFSTVKYFVIIIYGKLISIILINSILLRRGSRNFSKGGGGQIVETFVDLFFRPTKLIL